LEYALVLPHLLEFIRWPFVLRAALVVSLVCPIAICLGIFMPFALEQLKLTGTAHFVPWAWGINGIFSVLSPVLSVALSITWGINALLLSAIPIYLVAALSWPEAHTTASSGS
jgi:hypothetical protein